MSWNWLRNKARRPTARLELGERGEEFATRHLRGLGWKILARRFKSRAGEIDIVARDGEWLVFIEVKTRASDRHGQPSEAVNLKKQRHISKVALDYLRLLKFPRVRFRFDIVEVLLPKGAPEPTAVRVISNAFDLSEPYLY